MIRSNIIFFYLITSFLLFSSVAYAAEAGSSSVLALLYKVINFTALASVIYIFAKKPVSSIFAQIAEENKKEVDQVEAKIKELKSELHLKKEELTNYRNSAEERLENACNNADIQKRKIIAEAQLQSKKMKEQTGQTIQHEYAKAQTKLLEWAASYLIDDVSDKLKKNIQVGDIVKNYKNISS